MKARYHAVSSVAFGIGFWVVTRDFKASLVCLLSGVLIDLDHLIDFYIHNRIKLENPLEAYRRLCDWCLGLKFEVIYIFLHSLELILILWFCVIVFKWGNYGIAVALGFTQHMVLDIVYNRRKFIPPKGYFFLYRMKKGFKKDHLLLRP